MSANEFMYFLLDSSFYKYLSEKIEVCWPSTWKWWNNFQATLGKSGRKMPLNFRRRLRSNVLKISVYFVWTSILVHFNHRPHQPQRENILPHGAFSETDWEDSTLGQESEEKGKISILIWHRLSWSKTVDDKNNLISSVLTALNGIDFEPRRGYRRILGDTYEYMISQFAAGAGKKAGEFYILAGGEPYSCARNCYTWT